MLLYFLVFERLLFIGFSFISPQLRSLDVLMLPSFLLFSYPKFRCTYPGLLILAFFFFFSLFFSCIVHRYLR
jgi:hypothetical protein